MMRYTVTFTTNGMAETTKLQAALYDFFRVARTTRPSAFADGVYGQDLAVAIQGAEAVMDDTSMTKDRSSRAAK